MAEQVRLSEKATRYIEQLSKARCNSQWSEAPELARKIEKHAPWKNCLAVTARTEAAFELAIASRAGSKPTGIGQAVDTILLSVKESRATPEEVFQARTCIQWLHWIDGEWDQAILCIAPDAAASIVSENAGAVSEWMDVCIVKSAFIRGASLEAKSKVPDAIQVYQEAVARILSGNSPAKDYSQYKLWAERLLNRYARLSEANAAQSDSIGEVLTDSLEAFRAWSRVGSNGQPSRSGLASGGLALEERLSRRETWISYYKLLSSLVYQLSSAHNSHIHAGDVAVPSKVELYAEVQRVESIYDAILVKEVAFPQAHEYNVEIDEWMDLTMNNWAVFVGPAWPAEGVPGGDKRSLSKGMLEILYRGATRTFHSMTILRHLSAVHASLGEIDLAVRALNSYVTIGTKAKARVQKSGEAEPGVDNDDTFVSAISAGVEMLCVFGERKEADKARELSTLLRQMLDEEPSIHSPASPRNAQKSEADKLAESVVRISIHSRTSSIAHRAIGISLARWSFLTYEPAKRADLQQNALIYLRKSLRGSPGNESNVEALYALSLIAAEARETQGAVAAVKEALIQSTVPNTDPQAPGPNAAPLPIRPTTSTIRCWHLLTLLLASRQDYDNAADSCDEGLEVLTKRLNSPQSIATLDIAEKKSMLSIRMTRIALKELLEGSEIAVNDSLTLLTLYGEMFKAKPKEAVKSSDRLDAPSTVPGRTLSLRGSVFGRGRTDRTSHISENATASGSARRFSDSSAHQPPALNVPDAQENNRPVTSRSHRSLSRSGSKRLQKRPSKRSVHRTLSGAKQQPTTDGGDTNVGVDNVNKSAVTAAPPHLAPVQTGNNLQSEVGLAVSKDTDIVDTMATLPETEEPKKTIVQCLTVHYSEIEEKRRAQEMLIEIWIFIAGLYRRAGLYSDCASACIESLKQVRSLEVSVAAVKATADEFAKPGWGGAKSVEELKADALAERGHLELAISGPRSAKENYESALTHFPDHVGATVGLANLLLDIYSSDEAAEPITSIQTKPRVDLTESRPLLAIVHGVEATDDSNENQESGMSASGSSTSTFRQTGEQKKSSTSPEALDRLPARDRAFNLLSALSKLGTGWDQSEVWFALARAYELSGQLEKAQEALWWVVELEKKRSIRHWGCLGQGYSLWF